MLDISATIDRALRTAGLDPESSLVKGIQGTIDKALSAAGLSAGSKQRAPARPSEFGADTAADTGVIDVDARVVVPNRLRDATRVQAPPSTSTRSRFLPRTHSGPTGRRDYKLFVPAGHRDQPMPLLVMLHGCQQDPDDFAAGTRMNELAELHNVLVAYPAQSTNANGSNCWNWFKAEDQARDSGEPALIAGIVREITASHPVDEQRVFVAGLSAGAAMAVILGRTHPEMFAAVGAHSGLPYGAAHDVGSAFAAMSSGAVPPVPRRRPGATSEHATLPPVPTIVFHGDRDTTVNPANGEAIVRQATSRTPTGSTAGRTTSDRGRAGGRDYTTTVYKDAAGRPCVEHWVLHGASHAWSGGSADGSFTDTKGPDASAQMLRFFLDTTAGEANASADGKPSDRS